jgi:hypothetical protein
MFITDEAAVKNGVEDALNLFIDFAARNEGTRALGILLDSPHAKELEPLTVGIRLYLGEDVRVAAEIKEIGSDVAERIGQQHEQLRAPGQTRG